MTVNLALSGADANLLHASGALEIHVEQHEVRLPLGERCRDVRGICDNPRFDLGMIQRYLGDALPQPRDPTPGARVPTEDPIATTRSVAAARTQASRVCSATNASSSAISNGLPRYAFTFMSVPNSRGAVRPAPYAADMRMIGSALHPGTCRHFATNSRPLMTGIIRSITTMFGSTNCSSRSACSPFAAWLTR
jgi:hypothetical protein